MANRKYSRKHIEYLKKISPGRYNDEITKMFNKKFGMNATESAIRTLKAKNRIRSNVPKTKTQYTKEHLKYLKKLCDEGLFNKEITEKFNEKFNSNRTERAIRSIRGKYKISTSARKRWKKGRTPWNKGKTGYMGANKASFKKGNIPPNRVPVGTERIAKDGYIEIKIQDGKLNDNWKAKHILIWEKHNGKVPKGHCIIFGDGNNRNFDIDNLICVSRSQLARLNQYGLIKNHADLTRTGIAIANLKQKISERSKGK